MSGSQTQEPSGAVIEDAGEREKIVIRLRESKASSSDWAAERGYEAGRDWAATAASYWELRRLADFVVACGNDLVKVIRTPQSRCPGEIVFDVIHPEQVGDEDALGEFWSSAAGGNGGEGNLMMISGKTVYSFVIGAIEVLRSVEDDL